MVTTMTRETDIKSLPLSGDFIKLVRYQVKLSQTDMAKILGIKQSSLSLIEAGKRNFRVTPATVTDLPMPWADFLVNSGVWYLLLKPGASGVVPQCFVQRNKDEIVMAIAKSIKEQWKLAG